MANILIIKGVYGNTKITNSVLPLIKPLEEVRGKIRATVDASSVLGESHKVAMIDIDDYKLLE